ncbi:hypothetical protein EMPS_05759 [Entomortierella parvispora]|uniref:Coiled-coil SMC6 And NSE5 INteracting (CANIN) domain-containing protein n=1 Tax=Entomortierella parvispora TaxID=205924 RepID=A0A9P3HB16_9FUNG|nr:hypothetical protein EMPS_05759 [Entomortierella parvispora]
MGRHPKTESSPLTTRPISSYFFSTRAPAPREPSPPSTLGPTPSQEPPADATNFTPVENTNTMDDHGLEDPFNPPTSKSLDSSDVSKGSTHMQDSETAKVEPWQAESPRASEFDPLDSMDHLRFSSQLSSESIRRQALSPRKPKQKKELFNTAPIPTLSFSARLEAELERDASPSERSSPRRESSDVFMDAVEDIVEGSDPGSDAEWNDGDVFVSPKETVEEAFPETKPAAIVGDISSDDDIPDLRRFSSRKIPEMLEESESDLDDDPFSADTTPAATTATSSPKAPTPLQSTKAAGDDGSSLSDASSVSFSDEEDPFGGGPLAKKSPTKSTQKPSRVTTRSLRSSTVKAKPVVVNETPVKRTPISKARKPLFSLDSLLKEKTRREKAGYDIETAKAHMALDDNLLQEYNEDDEEDILFSPTVIPKGILSDEQEGVLSEIIQDGQDTIVDDFAEFFVHWPQTLSVPPYEPEHIDAVDPVIQKLQRCTRTGKARSQFLTSPFLAIMSNSAWRMPPSLFHWLVLVMAAEQNTAVTTSIFSVLQRALAQRTSLLGVDQEDLITAFRMYGAREEYLEIEWSVAPVTPESKRERTIDSDTPKFPRQNLKALIKLINMTATLDPLFYDEEEIRAIISLLLRMTTDPIIGDVKSALGSAIVALLNAIPEASWESERSRICDDILQVFGTSLPFVLLALHQLPSLSTRVTLLRRGIALAYLKLSPIPAGQNAPDLEELHRALFVDKEFMINSETNYRSLGQRIQVFSYCLDEEHMIASYGRHALEAVLRKLRLMHGKIVDVRAAFMERTVTKDLIQRLYMRLYYAGIHRQTVKQTTLNFEKATVGDNDSAVDLSTLRLVPELAPSSKN